MTEMGLEGKAASYPGKARGQGCGTYPVCGAGRLSKMWLLVAQSSRSGWGMGKEDSEE